MKCKRCGSTDLREYRGDVVNVSTGLTYYSFVACTECGLHANYDEWLDDINSEETDETAPVSLKGYPAQSRATLGETPMSTSILPKVAYWTAPRREYRMAWLAFRLSLRLLGPSERPFSAKHRVIYEQLILELDVSPRSMVKRLWDTACAGLHQRSGDEN